MSTKSTRLADRSLRDLWRLKLVKAFAAIFGVAVFSFGAVACTDDKQDNSAQEQTEQDTDDLSRAAVNAVPYPLEEMRQGAWLERVNLRERLLRYNDPNKISYIYLFSGQGQLMANYTVQGKVSQVASQLTTSQVQSPDLCGSGCLEREMMDAPLDDGTWGPSEDAIFFFTEEGVMVQWNGQYVLADAPLELTTQPVLVYNTSSRPTSTAEAAEGD